MTSSPRDGLFHIIGGSRTEGNLSGTAKIILGVLLAILLIFPLPLNPYRVQIAITAITYSMLGLAFVFSMRAGLPRLDIIAWWSIGSFSTALLINNGLDFWSAALISGLICVVLGWLFFSIALPRGMLIFFIFCLMSLLLAPNLIRYFLMVPFLRGSGGVIPPPAIGSYEIITKRDLYYVGLFFLGLNLAVYYLLYNSRIGRAWNAITTNLKLATSVGVDVVKYRMANLLIGNFFISLAGSYLVAFNRQTAPLTFSIQNGILVMLYPLVGGMAHSFAGPVLGAIIVAFFPEYLHFIEEYQAIIVTGILMLIIIFIPGGILGLIDRLIKRWLLNRQWYIRLSRRIVVDKT